MADYKDPKVTKAETSESSTGRWIAIAAVVIVALLVLAWLLGMFDDNVERTGTLDPVSTEETIVDDTATGTNGTLTEPNDTLAEPDEVEIVE